MTTESSKNENNKDKVAVNVKRDNLFFVYSLLPLESVMAFFVSTHIPHCQPPGNPSVPATLHPFRPSPRAALATLHQRAALKSPLQASPIKDSRPPTPTPHPSALVISKHSPSSHISPTTPYISRYPHICHVKHVKRQAIMIDSNIYWYRFST
jgi:hypothetical protein